nr:reverse transcriptase domain-containing protein [Tanacetum cinerariifolium]
MKEVEETCVICGGVHPYYDCIATNSNILSVCATTGTYNQGDTGFRPQVATNYRASLPGFPLIQNNQNRYNQNQNQSYSQNRGNNYQAPIQHPQVKLSNEFSKYKQITETKFDECLALEDLGASFNLMPLFICRKLSLPELTYTQMILELADRSTTRPAGIAKDVFVKVGKFHFLTDFVVVDYVIDPCVPLILRRPFLRAGRALIDVYGEELTLRVDDEAITFNVGQTSKYSYNNDESINQIDVIDVACEEYVQEVLGFSDKSKSGSPAPTSDPIISFSSPSFTPFEGSDFIMEEIETFLQTLDELSNLDDDY